MSLFARGSRRVMRTSSSRHRGGAVGVVGIFLAGMLLYVAPASASVQISNFNAYPSITQAGGHPDFDFEYDLTGHNDTPDPCDCDDAEDVTAHLPAGLIAIPHATPQCNIAEFSSDLCPVDSQLGIARVSISTLATTGTGGATEFLAPVFNLVPPPDQPALLGFKSGVLNTPTFEDVSTRTGGDYGLDIASTAINHFAPLVGLQQITWGIPAAPVHDALRFGFGQAPAIQPGLGAHQHSFLCDKNGNPSTANLATDYQLCPYGTFPGGPAGTEPGGPGGPVSSSSPEEPFLQNPTTCGSNSLESSLDVLSYDRGETHASSSWPPTTDCDQLSFNPSQSIAPTTTAADSPSGAEFRLTVPQFESPEVPSPSELKGALITLPEGFSFAPNVTNGKETCSEADSRFGTTEEAQCPEDSKIGSLLVETPVLPGPLPGAVYLGEPKPGSRFRLILVFNGFGVHVKLPGTATPNPQTGQIVISFQNLPQVPFAYYNAHFFGSERGPLDTPTQCGTFELTNEWTSWDSALSSQVSRQFFTIDEGPNGTPCPNGARPFRPGFQAASVSDTAAAHTAFSLNLTREDGQQNLRSLKVTTPPGFTATLRDLTYCPAAAIAAAAFETHTGLAEQANPSCPASSYVGELTAAAGPGTHPLYLPGRVYLAGPYQGAPLSFVFITPAVSGGYDLGNVVIREAIHVNPETAQVTAGGAELPQIFAGIPLRLRQILINLNRPGFALNPTDCNPLEVRAEVFGSEGALSTASQHFQVASCASLSFAPKLTMDFSGSTRRGGDPGLHTDLTYPSGGSDANVARVALTLPSTELIDNAHLKDPCTRAQFALGTTPGEKCPPGSIIGTAKAQTPLLEKSLEGPVYLRSDPENKSGLPNLVAALNGQIDITLVGKVDTVHGAIRTTFETVPDAPVSNFALSLDGGNRGLLQNNSNLCRQSLRVTADITGQNGKTANQNPVLSTPCGKKDKRKGNPAARGHHNRGAGQ